MSDSNVIQFPQIKSQPITLDFFMSQLRLALVAVLAYGGGKGWFTPADASLITALAASLGPIIVPWAWSIFSNLGTIRVSSTSAAAVVAKVESVDKQSAAAGATNALIANSGNPSAPTVSAIRSTAAASMLFAFIVAGLMFTHPAYAAPRAAKSVPVCDPLNLLPGCKPAITSPATSGQPAGLQKFMDDLASLAQTIVTNVVADINAADTDAATLTNPADPTSFKDPISHACYPAAVKFIQSLPTASAPTGTLIAVQLFQKKRDFVAQIQAGLPVYLKLGCAPLLGDEAAIFTKLMGLVGVNVALNALIPGAGALAGLTF